MTEYFSMGGVPGRYFVCSVFRATLGVPSCAGRWTAAQGGKRFDACKGCSLGAEHAGHKQSVQAPVTACCRCGEPSIRRMIGGLCLSCKNREYEVVKGRNGKGAPPRPVDVYYGASSPHKGVFLHRVRLSAVADGHSVTLSLPRVATPLEAILRALRQFAVAPAFARPSSRHPLPQMSFHF
jgi:hypothetical protein